MEATEKKWVVRFRVVSPSDYHTPRMYIPTEETRIKANSADEAWEKWVSDPYASPRDWYIKEEIYEYK